jgi:drug/metabolite transporter (DMT)-like permease
MRTSTAISERAPESRAAGTNPLKLAAAFACVYLIWGSTYLAIRFAIETIPPLGMAGARFLIAGAILYAWVAARGEAERPTAGQWARASALGALFFLGGNGGVSWAEQRVPSGITALFIASIPFWMVLLHWLLGRRRPAARILAGLALGLVGVGLLAAPGAGARGADPIGVAVLLLGSLSWAFGSILSPRLSHPKNHFQSTAMQMIAGGVALLVVGAALGEWRQAGHLDVSRRSLFALAYLILFGSIVGFSAYNWLLQNVSPAKVGTYALVNPAVAVLAGWAFAGEPITPKTLVAGAVILTAVGVIVAYRRR